MVLEVGEKVHVMTRRFFEKDLRRHFVGEVVAVEGLVVRLKGYAFVYNPSKNDYARRQDLRNSIFGLSDSGFIINVLPRETVVEEVMYKRTADMRLIVTDGSTFSLDINEFGVTA